VTIFENPVVKPVQKTVPEPVPLTTIFPSLTLQALGLVDEMDMEGAVSCNPMLNEAFAVELHEPFEDVTV
jgi:hypothetical protein